ncbi:Transcription factor CCAAT displacement CDP1 [Micractinium conductrix]|uniref:Protein CASP n=1 Tax=Micractinium conductrix TaxID=554055 RepID=A0A2P6VIJ4_9CHLO|nr:Transcription factor CCAAT displacement CDP1 [Micractinium conductrix]|eukprot:PSC73915.1 Transcription factor CCAAT displacement CDP1 [Micractinium conductrix]
MDRQRSVKDLASAGEVLPTVVQSFWKEFDLEGLRGRLDEQGMAVATAQEGSVKSRKALAERTKEFRRHAAQEVSKEVAPLLKAYQEEVDRLTLRAKAAEGAFLEVYQKLYEAPDPAPALASGLELASRAAQLEAEAAKMAQELGEYKAESQELKNQDFTIRKLEERARDLEAQLEEKDRQLAEQQKSAEAEMQERAVSEMQEREKQLSEELAQAQAGLDMLRRLHQASQNQLFSMQSKNEEEAAGLQSELERATEEMERSQQRLATLEQEKKGLLARLQDGGAPVAGEGGGTGGSGGAGRAAEESLRQELYAQRELATRLHSEVSALRQQLEAEAATWSGRCEGLRGSLAAKEAHAAALEAELGSRPTQLQVDELRQQLRILQAVSGYGADEDEPSASAAADGAGAGGVAAPGRVGLEAALVAKARRLEHQITTLRLELAATQGEAEAAAARAAELEGDLAAEKELVGRLEDDLLAAESAGGVGAGGSAAAAAAGATDGGQEGAGGAGREGESPMVAVLCSQRDRFRARALEVEAHLATLGQELKRVRADAEAMRADNLALVERLKFVQGYQGGGGGGGARRNAADDLEAGAVVGRYLQQYEQSINPFADFKAREREARRKQLPLQDKAMLAVGSLISGSGAARTAIFCYAMALHAVIFFILARTSHRHMEHLEELEETCLRLQHSHTAAAAGGGSALPGGGGLAAAAGEAAQAAATAALRLLRR